MALRRHPANIRRLTLGKVFATMSVAVILFSQLVIIPVSAQAPQDCSTTDVSTLNANNIDCATIYGDFSQWDPLADVPCSAGASGTVVLVGNDNIQKVFNYLVSQGLSGPGAAGIIGNLAQESGVNPTSGSLTPGTGYGIAQWTTADRQAALSKFATAAGKPVSDLGVQLGFLWQELTTSYKSLLQNLKVNANVDDAVNQFVGPDDLAGQPVAPTVEVQRSGGYENPSIPMMKNRLSYGEQALIRYGKGAPVGGGGGTTLGTDICGNTESTGTCTNQGDMKGIISILSCAQEFKGYGYVYGGGHEDPQTFMSTFMTQGGFNGVFRGTVDCSGLINVSVWNAFHIKLGGGFVASNSSALGSGMFREISQPEIQPGDLLIRDGDHVGVATTVGSNTANFAAHTSNAPPAQQIDADNSPGEFFSYFRYIGPGAQ